MSIVVGYAELLSAREEDEDKREAAQQILDAAARLSYATDDLITTFALDAGSLYVDPEHLELREVVAEVVRALEKRSRPCTFAIRSDEDEIIVSADDEHLGRVVRNLLLNACAFMPNGGDVDVALSHDTSYAAVAVTDRGVGIAPAYLERVFHRVPPPTGAGWTPRRTGLELFTAKRLVELQGGTISARSAPGVGSTFTFTVPLADSR